MSKAGNNLLMILQKEILKSGGKICDEEKVLQITPINESHVVVRSSKQSYNAKSVVLACGPWINKLLKDLNVTITAQVFQLVAS